MIHRLLIHPSIIWPIHCIDSFSHGFINSLLVVRFFLDSLIHRLTTGNYSVHWIIVQWFIDSLNAVAHGGIDLLGRWFSDSSSVRWLAASLAHWLIESHFTNSLIHWFAESPNHWLVGWSTESLVHAITDSLLHSFNDSWAYRCHRLIDSIIHCFIDSLVRLFTRSVVRGFFHVTSLASQPPCAHSLMNLQQFITSASQKLSYRSLISLQLFPIFETSAPARAGHYLVLS